MSDTLIAALIGALVGGSFALFGSVIQHFLSLREDRIKREREEEQKKRELIRQTLEPTNSLTAVRVVHKVQKTGVSRAIVVPPDEQKRWDKYWEQQELWDKYWEQQARREEYWERQERRVEQARRLTDKEEPTDKAD